MYRDSINYSSMFIMYYIIPFMLLACLLCRNAPDDPLRTRARERGVETPLVLWRSSARSALAVESAPALGP
jgi:hypothetical protein